MCDTDRLQPRARNGRVHFDLPAAFPWPPLAQVLVHRPSMLLYLSTKLPFEVHL